MTDLEETRRRSAAIFGNEKTVEVVLALSEEGAATAQMIATSTGIPYSLVRDALVRLVNGGVIRQVPRMGGSRSPLYYQPTPGNLWAAVLAAAQALAGPQETGTGRPPAGISRDV
jgi:ribosomal protein S25